jgi:hypothetical protein
MSDTRAGDRPAFFLLGAVIGAVTALLIATASGARTRRSAFCGTAAALWAPIWAKLCLIPLLLGYYQELSLPQKFTQKKSHVVTI